MRWEGGGTAGAPPGFPCQRPPTAAASRGRLVLGRGGGVTDRFRCRIANVQCVVAPDVLDTVARVGVGALASAVLVVTQASENKAAKALITAGRL